MTAQPRIASDVGIGRCLWASTRLRSTGDCYVTCEIRGRIPMELGLKALTSRSILKALTL